MLETSTAARSGLNPVPRSCSFSELASAFHTIGFQETALFVFSSAMNWLLTRLGFVSGSRTPLQPLQPPRTLSSECCLPSCSFFVVMATIAPGVRRHAVSEVLDPLVDVDLELLHSPLHPWDRVTKKQRDEFLLRMDTRGQTAHSRFKTVSDAQGKVLGARLIGSELFEDQNRITCLFPLPHELEVQFGCVPPRALYAWLRRAEGRLVLDIFLRRRAAASMSWHRGRGRAQ